MTRAVAVVGGGPAGLMAAEVLAEAGLRVTVYDRMPSLGRKLLMAGRGGLNLTHAEPFERLLERYRSLPPQLDAALRAWTPEALRAWCHGLGQDTFVGSSGRVFPTAMKASPLLRAWLDRLGRLGVGLRPRHRWTGWDADGRLAFEAPAGQVAVAPDATVLALGGASWPRLGSDGAWATILAQAGAAVAPLRPSNCAFDAAWSPPFRARHEGAPLKAVAVRFDAQEARGDLVVTARGLEGGALYALSGPIRDALGEGGPVEIAVVLRPDVPHARLADRLARRKPKETVASALRRTLNLAPVAVGLLQEAAHAAGETLSRLDAAALARRVEAVPVRLTGPAPLDRAISTAGGLRFDALDPSLMLTSRPGVFAAGEMLDWEAPTGGYLLQASFATGVAAAQGVLRWLNQS